MNLNRRSLLQSGVAAVGLAAVPRRAAAREEDSADVIVIGAGLSGLNAAMILEQAGLSVRIIEGRDRIGGRVLSLRNIPGNPEAGANSYFDGYARLMDLCQRLEIKSYDYAQRRVPNSTYMMFGENSVEMKDWPQSPFNLLSEPYRKLPPFGVVNTAVKAKNPLKSPEEWGLPANAPADVSVHEALRNWGFDDAQIQLIHDTNPQYGSNAHELSIMMWYFLDAWITRLSQFGRAEYIAQGGNATITDAMANTLKNDVRLNREVVAIDDDGRNVEVRTRDGSRYRGRHVVCALPVPPLRHIRFSEKLPPILREAILATPQMKITQIHLVPEKPFWEKDGLPPGMWTDGLLGQVQALRCGDDPAAVSSLIVWGRGFAAEYFDALGEKAACEFVVRELARLRPASKGAVKIGGFKSWQLDPFSGGDWVVWRPGQMSRYIGPLGTAHGRVHFCGEHTSFIERGMEAAMETGERAALEILNG